MSELLDTRSENCRPLHLLTPDGFDAWRQGRPVHEQRWLAQNDCRGRDGDLCLLPGADGAVSGAVRVAECFDTWTLGDLADRLPGGCWRLEAEGLDEEERLRLVLGWVLGGYRFARYLSEPDDSEPARLRVDERLARRVAGIADGIHLVRDLVNTPAEDMMPQHLSSAMQELAAQYAAEFHEVVGEALLEQNFPAIHAVGRASRHAPRLLDLRWGAADAPRVTLVGKGVCFDSGGLDLKPANAMRLMKKDMGGAAHALGLARMIMAAGLPLRLRVLIPAVENAVSGNAFRPGDVIATRKGLTVEIENTDAEGRLVLCDALAEACNESPELLIDFATLTGAARVALGTEVPALFASDDGLAREVMSAAQDWSDPVWQLPLHAPYAEQLKSRIADLMNCSSGGFGGAITAALFLQRFVGEDIPWLHLDLMAWNNRARPGRPEGGEAMGLLGLFDWLRQRYPLAP